MPIQKQNLEVPLTGLDQKNDPFKLAPGKLLELENSIFQKGGASGILIQKRDGFPSLADLPDSTFQFITTFNENLVAIGTGLSAYSQTASDWVDKGDIRPIVIDTLSLIKTSSNQSQVDSAISNDLICTVYTDDSPSTAFKYAIADVTTGQNIVASTTITPCSEPPRVFVLTNYFVIVYSQGANLKYISIPVLNPSNPTATVTLVTNYAPGSLSQPAFDGYVANNNLYVGYNATDGGGAIRVSYLNSFLVRQTPATGTNIAAGKTADIVSVTADITGVSPVIWVSFHETTGNVGYTVAVDQMLNILLAALGIAAGLGVVNIASVAQNSNLSAVFEVANTYSYGTSLPTNYLTKITVNIGFGITSNIGVIKSVGLASKAFLNDGNIYVLSTYTSAYQPSYFLLDVTGVTDYSGMVVSKLAYSNGGGYLTKGLPSVSIDGTVASIGYLIKDLIQAANKEQSPTSQTPVFTQTGINLASFDFTTDGLNASDTGGTLHISGGIVWEFDGYQVVEQGFNVYPDNVISTTVTGAGSISAQTYYYVALYEWTDNQGNVHRSAPSLAVQQVTTTASSTNTIKVPTLRLTDKTLVKIILYRWSTANQTYYQVTSLTSPTLNDVTVDNITITDTLADASIVGNSILYTTGGVVENVGAPGTSALTIFKSRQFLIDSEDQNLLWYSKQVIEATPVEFSDLFTIFVSPSIGASGNTGPITALAPMDDKLIIFKKNAMFYIVGNGPDNTGANNDFSDPVFITSTVGSDNHNSIAFIPNGLLFESDKGIWLLGRDLSTTYIGKDVEDLTNEGTVLSVVVVPGTNQVRFTLDSGITLVYDYFFGQWGTFTGISGISSTIYQLAHTYINSLGKAFQQSAGTYLDGSNPVLISFKTGWFNLAGLQGFERAYFFYLLGTYLSPHTLSVQIAYDYNDSATQTSTISPNNFSAAYGGDSLFGGSSVFGGASNIEQWRVFFQKQKCEAFQITITESYDPSMGVAAGAGLTLSGLDLVVGLKSAYPRLRASTSVG